MERILIVDNDPVDRILLNAHLVSCGFTNTIEVSDVDSAIRLLELGPFELIFIDCDMRPKNGLDFIWRVRHDMGLERVPMIMTTSRTDITGTIGKQQVGYLQKPIVREELEKWLRLIFPP